MQYTARSITASSAPWPLQVNDRTYHARPLSAALVLRLFPRMAQASTRAEAVTEALRAAFPEPAGWWARRFRDPLRAVFGLDVALQAEIVQRLFAVPGQHSPAEDDPVAALMAAHRKLAHPTERKTGPTLAIAALTCEVRMGAAWYYAPTRWSTVDGYAPLATVWTTYLGLQALDARERLSLASAVRLGMADGQKTESHWRSLEAAAFPPDPTMRGAA